jgi:hypothetical protein
MKIVKILAVLGFLLSLSSDILLAQDKSTQYSETAPRIEAFSLVNAAYQGRLKKWGIPAYAKLDQAYRGKQITASDLIEAAVEANQLSPDALEDEAYIKAVDTNLYGLVTR